MKDSEAMMVVENALSDAGLSVLSVGAIDTGHLQVDHHPDIPEGVYKVVQVTVAVSIRHHAGGPVS